MKKYIFVMSGNRIAATMDGSGVPFNNMVDFLQKSGYQIKEVSEIEYRYEEKRQENVF